MSTLKNSILDRAKKILDRKEEKERKYGPFDEGMEFAAQMLRIMTGKDFDKRDMYLALVALKLSRHRYSNHYDSILDTIVYLANMVDEGDYDDELSDVTPDPYDILSQAQFLFQKQGKRLEFKVEDDPVIQAQNTFGK